MSMRIHLSVPSVGPAEQEAMAAALASGSVAPVGPQLTRFEENLAARTGRARAVAVASGTAALHLQLIAAGIRPGDRVVCPTLTFVATLNAISYIGAVPVLVDSDETGNLDPDLVEEAFETPALVGGPIAAVVPVDLYGKVADHSRLQEIADRHGAQLLVDAAESLGARRDGRAAGGHGRAAAVSFNGNKIITASSGGAVLTDDEELADHVSFLSYQAREPVPHYLHRVHGFNYRLSNILAALGDAQLSRLDEFLAARRAHRERYREMCEGLEGVQVLGGSDEQDNCWLAALEFSADPSELGERLLRSGIETRRLFTPLHTQPLCADPVAYPRLVRGTAERLFATTLVVPSSPASSTRDIEEVCELIAGDTSVRRRAEVLSA